MAFVFIVDSFSYFNEVAIVCCKSYNQGKDLKVNKIFSASVRGKLVVLLYDGNEYQAIVPVGDTSKYFTVFWEVLNVCMHAL